MKSLNKPDVPSGKWRSSVRQVLSRYGFLGALLTVALGLSCLLVPIGFMGDDFVYLNHVQESGSLLRSAFWAEPLFGAYYRPLGTLLWGFCYRMFGLWGTGYSIVLVLLFMGTLTFFYMSVATITNGPSAFVTGLIFLFNTFCYMYWLSWYGSLLQTLFLWFAIYNCIKACRTDRKVFALLSVFGALLAVLSKESSYIPLVVMFGYASLFCRGRTRFRSVVFGISAIAIVAFACVGPSGVFRSSYGLASLRFVGRNFEGHMSSMLGTYYPLYFLPLAFFILLYGSKGRHVTLLIVFAALALAILLDETHSSYYAFGLVLLIMSASVKHVLWHASFLLSFATILPFDFLSPAHYHINAFSFLLVSFCGSVRLSQRLLS